MTSSLEQLVLDSLALNDATTFGLESLSMNPPAKKPEWISGADSNGAILGRDPLHENRVVEARIGIEPQATRDLVLAKIGLIVDKLQECSLNENGLPLVWTPADASINAITFRCLMGEITDLPIDWQSGWLGLAPMFTVRLICLPFGEGVESAVWATMTTAPIATIEITDVLGDVAALARIVVTDSASQNRRYVALGMESRWYPTSSPPSLIVDSTAMVTSGYAGVTATRSGAYSGGSNNVIGATLRTQVQAICGLGNLTHIGQFRPMLRFYASATTMAVRLTYQTLDGPFRSLAYKVPVVAGLNCVDLGLVTLPEATSGAQRWTGRIEAYSTATGGETFQADVVLLMPAERYGRARAPYSYETGVLVAYDDFTGMTAGAALNAQVSDSGQTWVTSGAGTDYTAADAPAAADETVKRATVSDAGARFAVLGATSYAATEVSVTLMHFTSVGYGAAALIEMGVIARWVDASNYLRFTLRATIGPGRPTWELVVTKVVAGAATQIVSAPFVGSLGGGQRYQLRLTAHASGGAVATLLTAAGVPITSLNATDAVLATGGALASGKPGLYDINTTTMTGNRYYDSHAVAVPPAEPIACYSGQSITFSSDSVLREDATGTYAGKPPEDVGGRFYLPQAGGAGRKSRVAVIARRGDIETSADDYIADSTTVQVYATPRYLAIPR